MSDDYEALQKKQLFAQRVTAVSAVAAALAASQAAGSLEKMRQEASDAAEANADHQRAMEEVQEAQLAVIERQARAEAKARDYQQRVLFLKESDDATKLETYLEMTRERLLFLYNVPVLPEECQSCGQLTCEINLLQTPRVKYTNLLLPNDAIKMQGALTESKNKQYGLQRAKSDLHFGTFCKYSLGAFVIAMLVSTNPPTGADGNYMNKNDILSMRIFMYFRVSAGRFL